METLPEAVARADRIVVGRVSHYTFGSWGSSISVVCESTLKGPATPTVTVPVAGGPFPADATFSTAVLMESEAAPVLLPGKRAVFFLEASPPDGGLWIQGFSGQYEVVGGAVQPVSGNPFGDSIRGMSLADFVARIRQAG